MGVGRCGSGGDDRGADVGVAVFPDCTPRARQILREVEQAVSQWRYVGRGLGMTTQELDQFADAFEHEERAAARTASQ